MLALALWWCSRQGRSSGGALQRWRSRQGGRSRQGRSSGGALQSATAGTRGLAGQAPLRRVRPGFRRAL